MVEYFVLLDVLEGRVPFVGWTCGESSIGKMMRGNRDTTGIYPYEQYQC